MPVKGQSRLARFYESTYSDTTDVYVEGDMLYFLSVECGTVKWSVVWRAVKEEHAGVQRLGSCHLIKIILYSSPLDFSLSDWNCSNAFFGG